MLRQTSFLGFASDVLDSLQVMRIGVDGDSALEEVSRASILHMANAYAHASGFESSNLRPRDLRIVDATFEPTVAVRLFCILVNVPPARCLIFPDQVLLLIDAGADDALDKFKRHLTQLQGPFELRALETALWQCTFTLEKLRGAQADALQRIRARSDVDHIEAALRECDKQIAHIKSLSSQCRGALQDLSTDDADMALVNLSRVAAEPELFRRPHDEWDWRHTEVEILLEAYTQALTATYNKLDFLAQDVESDLRKSRIRRVSWRNRMIRLETFMRGLTASAGVGSLVAAIFGMNLTSGLASEPDIFWPLFISLVAVVLVIFVAAIWVINEEG